VTLAGGTLLVLLALALMTLYLDPSAVLAEMAEADPVLVALAAVVYLLSWPLRGARYRDILATLGYHEAVGFLTGAIFVSQTGNLVFPARAGDAVRAYVVKVRRGIPYPSGFASLAVERVFDLLTIAVLSGAVLLGLAAVGPTVGGLEGAPPAIRRSGRTALAVAAMVGIAAVLAVVAIVASARSETNLVRRAVTAVSDDSYAVYVSDVIGRFVADIQTVAGDRGAFRRVGTTSLLIWVVDVLTALVVFAAFGIEPSPYVVAVGFFAVSVGNLAKVLPLSPGGVGLYEGAFTLIVVALVAPVALGAGTAREAAAVALGLAIVDHAVKNVVTIVGGVIATALLNVSLTRAVVALLFGRPGDDWRRCVPVGQHHVEPVGTEHAGQLLGEAARGIAGVVADDDGAVRAAVAERRRQGLPDDSHPRFSERVQGRSPAIGTETDCRNVVFVHTRTLSRRCQKVTPRRHAFAGATGCIPFPYQRARRAPLCARGRAV
jgi:uncharacterized protein (TIRG00374 family)